MIKKIKLGFRMMRYCFGLKSCLIGMILFFAVGLLMHLVPAADLAIPNFFLMLVIIWPSQLIYSLSVSDMIGTSPKKKEMQTMIPALVCGSFAVAIYLLMSVLAFGHRNEGTAKSGLLIGALCACTILLYASAAYKFFIGSTIVFFIIYGGIGRIQFLRLASESVQNFFDALPYEAAVGIGLLMILAGVLAEYAISVLIYRFPLTKRAQMRGLQKTM